jgi:hypothetical protein
MNNCIAVLTRGYENIENYDLLIKRNIHINDNLHDKTLDILIFNEGNISEEHQIYIKNKTPELNIQFINISNIAFQTNKQNIEFEEKTFPLNYKHMCSFWFINFFNVVEKYDKLLRIDEDCFIHSNIDEIFLHLNKYTFVSGILSDDAEQVTIGLNNFSLEFLDKYKEEFEFEITTPKKPYGPYTNLIGFSLNNIRNNNAFQKYMNDIDNSEMIYKRRWGDLPLWGEAIYYIFGDDSLFIDTNIKYFHGSHGSYINC